MRILGIETSCDETAAAIVIRDNDGIPQIQSNIVWSQVEDHAQFGGVVPELAARAHLSNIDKVVTLALEESKTTLDDIDAVGVTAGPGLMGGLLVGLMTAKAIAASKSIPLIAVNHLEGHALTPRLTDNIDFPYMLLLVSGGHSQILRIEKLGDYQRIATTIDDAVGETFDKTAKLLGLGYPGGPAVEKAASNGNADRFDFPKPLAGRDTLNMSFSGLKTAVRTQAQKLAPLSEQDVADICSGVQATIAAILTDRCRRALAEHGEAIENLVVAGGVAANGHIRQALEKLCDETGIRLIAPPHGLCTDNAAMIAWAALENFEKGEMSALDIAPRSRWPLDKNANHMVGKGRRGAKV